MEKKTLNINARAAVVMLLISAVMSFSACDRNEYLDSLDTERPIGFKASVGNVIAVDTEATKASNAASTQVGSIMLTSADGSISIPMAVFKTEGVAVPETKGSLVNEPLDPDDPNFGSPMELSEFIETVDSFQTSAYFTDSRTPAFPELSKVSWNGSSWAMADVYYWPQSTGLDVYACANMPESKYAEIAIDKEARTQTLTYTVPRDTDDQTDILMAMYSGTGDNRGKAELLFYHPLTAVQFARDASMTEASGITEIIMTGVNYGGTVTQSLDSPAILEWNVDDKEHTVSQDNDGKPFEIHRGIDGDPFLLVPQIKTAFRSVVLTVTLIYNGHEIPLNAIINDTNWFAGSTYTYIIGYKGNLEVSLNLEETSDTQKSAAVIANTGTKKCYVRAIVDGFVTDKDHYIKRTYLGNEGNEDGIGAFTADSGIFGTGTWNTNWVMGADGFYYYKLPLEVDNATYTNPQAKTTPLFNSYVFNGLSAYEYYEMNISTQAIEWDSSKSYVTKFWGAEAAELLQ